MIAFGGLAGLEESIEEDSSLKVLPVWQTLLLLKNCLVPVLDLFASNAFTRNATISFLFLFPFIFFFSCKYAGHLFFLLCDSDILKMLFKNKINSCTYICLSMFGFIYQLVHAFATA